MNGRLPAAIHRGIAYTVSDHLLDRAGERFEYVQQRIRLLTPRSS